MQLNHSQEWLGDQLGLTFQQVQKYEKGSNRIGGSRMKQIADALGVTPAYFYEDAPGKKMAGDSVKIDENLRAFTTSRSGLDIVAAWPSLTPKLRSLFADTIQAAAKAH